MIVSGAYEQLGPAGALELLLLEVVVVVVVVVGCGGGV